MVEKTEEFLGKFVFHLFDTHGLPKEITEERLKYYTYEQLLRNLLKHKDFLKQWKKQDFTL